MVLVIAPREAAGLGDFQKEAERLARFDVCRFVYAHSRFQGEGAAGEIAAAALQALRDMQEPPDAIALIRGGGAVNDLAWLNDYLIARFICDQEIPVLTGIGHERDSALADEVAHTRFDTPSKVVAGIEQQILRRAREASSAWQAIASESAQAARAARLAIERRQSTVTADARLHLASARQRSDAEHHRVAVHASRQVHVAARESLALRNELRSGVLRDLAAARESVPSFMTSIRIGCLATLAAARAQTRAAQDHVLQRSGASAHAAAQRVDAGLQHVAERASGALQQARVHAQALMREVTGQGPEKTLARGFAIVKTKDGALVTSRVQALLACDLDIRFRDGPVTAQIPPMQGTEPS